MIKKITLIGSGNVAHNLGAALKKSGFEIVEVYSRTLTHAQELAKKLKADSTNLLLEINRESDLYIIATSDNAITEVAQELDLGDKLIVHTSGSVGIEVLNKTSKNYGSFYPLQTFTRSHQADFSEIPICIEGSNKKSLHSLEQVSEQLTNNTIEISSTQRQKLHLAAVFVSNFANYMQVIGEDLCKEQQIDFELLKPLMKEVYEKNQLQNPSQNQTGPALRGDTFTINKHLELLKENKELSEVYQLISRLIKRD